MLYETIETKKSFYKEEGMQDKFTIPDYITNNIKYPLFDWQRNAIENLIIAENSPNIPTKHLMFNMATGTGKTLLMAACILYYYKQGYRHFLFFVNQNNIVDKTENNFINNQHNKYLFKQKIVIDNKTVNIKKVDSFSQSPQGIEIKFTTVQKFYNNIHAEKENVNTLEELNKLDLVMLADEAHHFNANTKNIKVQTDLFELKGSANEKEKLGWEHTILNLVLDKNPKHILLEFTATIPKNKEVQEKYNDKIIAKYDLKDFLKAGFTKQINLLAFEAQKKERILTALLFAWYRYTVALKYHIPHFKSVILFRSKTIAESLADYEYFLTLTQDLTSKDFNFVKTILNNITNQNNTEKSIAKIFIQKIINLIDNDKASFTEICDWIKYNYTDRHCIITNSKTNQTGKEKTNADTEQLLNNLEDKNNPIRAIFTVDRLTEGWDVLNLFDIVRLYEGQNAGGSNKKTPEATVAEMQLIGRGVRYYPFDYNDKICNERKFDDDLNHDLRALEELFFHTFDDSKARYISHLRQELTKEGYIENEKKRVITFKLKDDFANKATGINLFINKRIPNPERKKKDFSEVKQDFCYTYTFPKLNFTETHIDFNENQQFNIENTASTHTIILNKIPKHLFLKAMAIKSKADNAEFQFRNLQKNLNINSVNDLLNDQFLGDIKLYLTFYQTDFDHIPAVQKVDMLCDFIDKFFTELNQYIHPYKGDKVFKPQPLSNIFNLNIGKQKLVEDKSEEYQVSKKDWYVLNAIDDNKTIDFFVGTGLEKDLVQFIESQLNILEKEYDDVYLLRNEEIYKIYDFEQGRGFQPDFLLFLKSKESQIQYQIFIEPKGKHLLETDKWKEDFLLEISKRYGFEQILKAENKNYKLIGLPFYKEKENKQFIDDFNQYLTSEK